MNTGKKRPHKTFSDNYQVDAKNINAKNLLPSCK